MDEVSWYHLVVLFDNFLLQLFRKNLVNPPSHIRTKVQKEISTKSPPQSFLQSTLHRYKTTSVAPGALAAVLTCYQNLHGVHHLYPAAPFYRYGRIWRSQGERLRARGMRVREPLWRRPAPETRPASPTFDSGSLAGLGLTPR